MVLFSFVGNHDPSVIPEDGADPGPVLSLLQTRRFDHVVLFITRGEYSERARVIQQALVRGAAGTGAPVPTFSFVDIALQSVVDYEEIYGKLAASIARVRDTLPYHGITAFVLLDPGTPQMQTVWFLMVQAGALEATLLQGIPRRFGGGVYRSREVRIDPRRFPVSVRLREYAEPPELHAEPRDRIPTSTAERPSSGAGEWTLMTSDMVGRSQPMRELLHLVSRAARYSEVVTITGETGTGKELVARHIHSLSPRAGQPFIPLNAASLTDELVESHLFGHTKGAFTGATAERMGAFRSADGGTLFLDEVGELPLPAQGKLLRAIDRGEIAPVGIDRPIHVDVRLVVATHRDVPEMVAAGTFREDLFERLQQLPIHVPPLRDRDGDVELLAETFLSQWNDEHDTTLRFSAEALEVITSYQWPRNVRQLQNVVRRLCVFSDDAVISAESVRANLDAQGNTEPEAEAADADGRGAGDAGGGRVRAARVTRTAPRRKLPATAPR